MQKITKNAYFSKKSGDAKLWQNVGFFKKKNLKKSFYGNCFCVFYENPAP